MKCEVIKKVSLIVDEGSIVEVDPRQFEIAKRYLKPIEEKPKKTKKAEKSEE